MLRMMDFPLEDHIMYNKALKEQILSIRKMIPVISRYTPTMGIRFNQFRISVFSGDKTLLFMNRTEQGPGYEDCVFAVAMKSFRVSGQARG